MCFTGNLFSAGTASTAGSAKPKVTDVESTATDSTAVMGELETMKEEGETG